VKLSTVQVQLSGEKFEAERLSITLASTLLRQDYLALQLGDNVVVITIQDSLDDEGKPTLESATVRELLEKSFQRKPL
jgi:hypothetical protein